MMKGRSGAAPLHRPAGCASYIRPNKNNDTFQFNGNLFRSMYQKGRILKSGEKLPLGRALEPFILLCIKNI